MSATIVDDPHTVTLPPSICDAAGLKPNDQIEWRIEEGEIRGRKIVSPPAEGSFPPGSLLPYLTPERDQEQLAILSGCISGPVQPE